MKERFRERQGRASRPTSFVKMPREGMRASTTSDSSLTEDLEGFGKDEVEPEYLEKVMGSSPTQSVRWDYYENWQFPGMDAKEVTKNAKSALKRFEARCAPLNEILNRHGILQKEWKDRWKHLDSSYHILRNITALEYRIARVKQKE